MSLRAENAVIAADDVRKIAVALLNSTLELGRQDAACTQRFRGVFASKPWVGVVAARIKIHRRVTLLGPRMDRDVRFGQNDRSGNALRFKAMKSALHDGSARGLRGSDHHSRDAVYIRKQKGATAR